MYFLKHFSFDLSRQMVAGAAQRALSHYRGQDHGPAGGQPGGGGVEPQPKAGQYDIIIRDK